MMEGQGSQMLDHQRTASVGHLVLSSLLTMLPVLTYGALQSYLTIGLPQLLEKNPTGILLDLNKMSWIISASMPTRIVGLFSSGFISDKLGRKKCLILSSILQIASSCSAYFCSSFSTLLTAVALSNLFSCMVQVPSYSLLSEICLITYRGHLASLNTFNSNCGWLLGLSVGLFVPVQYFYFTLCFPSLIFLFLCWRLPESPVWLMRKGNEKGARETLQWLRGDDYNVTPEIDELKDVINDENEENEERSSYEILASRSFLLPLLLTYSLFVFQANCGIDLTSYYIGVIFKESSVKPQQIAILFQLLITLGYLGSPLLLSRMDCKYINMIFLTSIAMAMAGIGVSFTFPGLLGPQLTIPCLVVAGASYGLGVGPVSFVLMSSLFSQKNKSLGVAFAQTTRQIAVLVQVKAFPTIIEMLGVGGVFFFATTVSLAGVIFSYLIIPKTKNKSLYELEVLFSKEKSKVVF